eukprot:2449946-Rhodomonas_salina.4
MRGCQKKKKPEAEGGGEGGEGEAAARGEEGGEGGGEGEEGKEEEEEEEEEEVEGVPTEADMEAARGEVERLKAEADEARVDIPPSLSSYALVTPCPVLTYAIVPHRRYAVLWY